METEDLIFNTFIIGVQKAGTSYLKDILSQHPEIETHHSQEFMGFLDPVYKDEAALQKSIKQSFNKDQLSSKKHILGKSVGLFVSQVALKRLFLHNKNVKLIVVLRNPIDRVFSAYNYCLSRGLEKNKSFPDAIRERNRYPNDVMRSRNCNYINTSMYYLHIDLISEFVKKERIMLINFEDLKNNPNKICADVFKFMGLPHDNVLLETRKVVNAGVKARFPKLNSIFKIKNTWINKLWKKLPPDFRSKALNNFWKLNTIKKTKRDSISSSDSLYLKEVFREDLEKLKSKYGIHFN